MNRTLVEDHEEKLHQAKKSFRESPSKQFWKYLTDYNVLETFQPALALLYEMPVKPENLYEFLAEYLENGAMDLLKISNLQAELCYKGTELELLFRAHPELWHDPSMRQSLMNLDDPQFLTNFRHSLLVTRQSVFSSPGKTSIQKPSFLPLDDDDPEDYELRAKLEYKLSTSTSKVFKLEPQTFDEQLELDIDTEPLDVDVEHETLVKKEVTTDLSDKPKKAKVSKKKKKGSDAESDTQVRQAKKKSHKPQDEKEPRRKGSLKEKGLGVKGQERKSKKIVTTTQQQETAIGPSLLDMPLFRKKSDSKPQYRRISQLVAPIQDPEERLAMESVLITINNHRKIDPNSILFNFSRRHAAKEYEKELFARGASEYLLRRLSHRDSDVESEQIQEIAAELTASADTSQSSDPNRSPPSEQRQRRMSEAELKEVLTEQNHRRLLRDAFDFLHNSHKEAVKARRLRLIRKSADVNRPYAIPAAESDSNSSDDENLSRHCDGILAMLRETFDETVADPGTICQTTPLERFEPADGCSRPSASPSIAITVDDESATRIRSRSVKVAQPTVVAQSFKSVSRQELWYLIDKMQADYNQHLEFIESIQLQLPSLYSNQNTEVYKQEMQIRFHTLMSERREQMFQVLKFRLDRTARKRRTCRTKDFLRKRGNCKNIGYTRFEPFVETQRKEELRRDFTTTLPSVSTKAYHRFLNRFGPAQGSFQSEGLRTKPDFVYDFPLAQVEATQRWIDRTFPESVFNLNEPLGNPEEDVDFEDDDDDNYVWAEDFSSAQKGGGLVEDNLPISAKDYDLLQDCLRDLDQEGIADPRVTADLVTDRPEVECLEESKMSAVTDLKYSDSVLSLLHVRPPRKAYKELKRSERAREYVQKTFNPSTAQQVLNQFPFELFDDDYH